MAEPVTIRPLAGLQDAVAASALFDRIWGERRVMGAPLLRAMSAHGGQVLGAFRGEEMVGAQAGLIGLVDGKPGLHSHITGVLEEVQHQGVGFLLKVAQREWCLEQGIERVTWTFDPMVARNAYFNLNKLGAVALGFHRDYYGAMGDAFNAGDRSDRLEVVWDLESDRVRRALREDSSTAAPRNLAAPLMVYEQDGEPVTSPEPPGVADALFVQVPQDYHGLRAKDEGRARRWREALGDALDTAFGAGFVGTAFVTGERPGYLLEPR